MASITIAVSEDRLVKLRETANWLKISPEDLIRISIEDLLSQPDETFRRVADHVLEKNSDLYRRLA
jgi:antitoxin FitA